MMPLEYGAVRVMCTLPAVASAEAGERNQFIDPQNVLSKGLADGGATGSVPCHL